MEAGAWQIRLRSRDHIGRREQVVPRRGGGEGASLPVVSDRTTADTRRDQDAAPQSGRGRAGTVRRGVPSRRRDRGEESPSAGGDNTTADTHRGHGAGLQRGRSRGGRGRRGLASRTRGDRGQEGPLVGSDNGTPDTPRDHGAEQQSDRRRGGRGRRGLASRTRGDRGQEGPLVGSDNGTPDTPRDHGAEQQSDRRRGGRGRRGVASRRRGDRGEEGPFVGSDSGTPDNPRDHGAEQQSDRRRGGRGRRGVASRRRGDRGEEGPFVGSDSGTPDTPRDHGAEQQSDRRRGGRGRRGVASRRRGDRGEEGPFVGSDSGTPDNPRDHGAEQQSDRRRGGRGRRGVASRRRGDRGEEGPFVGSDSGTPDTPRDHGAEQQSDRRRGGRGRRGVASRRRGDRGEEGPFVGSDSGTPDNPRDHGAEQQSDRRRGGRGRRGVASRRRGDRGEEGPFVGSDNGTPDPHQPQSGGLADNEGEDITLRTIINRGEAPLPEERSATTTGNTQQMRSQEVRGRPRVHASDAERQRSRRQRESSQERAARLHADRLRHQRARARETSQERVTRHQEDADRHRQLRESETSQERDARHQEDSERHQRARARETSQERAARHQEDSQRHRELRERETSQERAARHQEDSQRHRELRQRETSQERAARHQEDSQRHRELRQRETSQERTARHQEDADRHRQLRERETSQERAARHQEDSERHQRSRTDEDSEERRVRLTTDAERHRRRRSLPSRMLGIALGGRVAVSSYLGRLSHRCQHCGALHFRCEVKPQHRDRFLECCDLGRFNLNYFEQFPDDLRRLFIHNPTDAQEQQRIRRNFIENIRTFNSALAMASMGAQVDAARGRGPYCFRIHGQIYHRVGPLHPREGEQRQYGQIYILDTAMAAGQRLGDPRNAECDSGLMLFLSELLSRINVYAQSFKMMSEVEQAELAAAARENRTPFNIRMIFEDSTDRGLRRRQFDLPTANEVAVVYVGEDNDVPPTRSFAVHLRNAPGEQLQSIRDIDKICDPLTYPLLFPTGEGGWEPAMTNDMGGRITQKEYYSYLLSVRDTFNPILRAGKLFQQFAVDAYVKIEQNRLNFQRRNQLRLRADSYRGLQDYLAGEDNIGPPGNRIVLSSSHLGSPRSMQQSYQDAMAIVARYGKPTYFLTMTCNPRWREIQENLYSGQTASDRPDLVARVFNAKMQELCDDIFKRHILGEVQGYVYVVEFQKRGLPHCHMLIIMKDEWKVRTAEDVDRSICAEIPNSVEEPLLHAAVTSYMIHRRCGQIDSPCTRNGTCSKRFPKQIRERTSVDVDGYPNYRRRNLHPVEISGVLYDDQWVVPSNPYLLMKYDCHINLEICGMISAVKYLYKYIYKGPDRARINIESDRNADESANVDEIRQHLNTRYVCAPQSMYRIFGFAVQDKSHTIYRLAVHLPDFQTVHFLQGREREYLDQARQSFTTLTAYFELNRQHAQIGDTSRPDALINPRGLYYYQLPEHFTFTQRNGWSPRTRGGKNIGRMYTVSPRDSERYCLRILLLNTKGKTSFEDLRTVDGITFNTFAEATKRAGFLDDDRYFRQSLEEAAQFQSAACIRSFFSCMLCFSEVVQAQDLWNDFADAMSDDYIHQGFDRELAIAYAYFDVLDRVALLGKNLEEMVSPPVAVRPVAPAVAVDYEEHERNGLLKYASLNVNQKAAADDIIDALDRSQNRCIFIDGPGGSGKTYLYNTVYDIAVGKRRQVACVAWTGIAANLLPKGRTANSLFKLNIADSNRTSSMKRQQKEARELMSTDMIIWDEISMAPKVALEAVDFLLRDIMQNDQPFGGKVMIVGGDFRQVLPVVEHGQREDFVQACVHKSSLWPLFSIHHLDVNMRAREAGSDWHQHLLEIGNGSCNNVEGCVQLPEDMMCYTDIVTEIFGPTLDPSRTSELCECAILAPKNSHVQRLNDVALDRLIVERTEDERTYKSVDEAIYPEGQYEQLFQQEYLNSLTPTGMPPHELRLKKGAIVMLLRNLDVANGLCNGTRLKVEELGRFTLGCKFICGSRAGELAIIPRIDNYWDNRAPFRLRRRQFPVRVAFAMTINKAQGQSFEKVGVYLPEDVFSHGQLYVALSRAKTPNGIKIKSPSNMIKNIVFNEVLL